MSYGLEVYDASGQATLTVFDRLKQLYGIYLVGAIGAGGSTTVSVPDMVNTDEWLVVPYGQRNLAQYVEIISGGFMVKNATGAATSPTNYYVFRG